MSMELFIALLILMATNQLMGTLRGSINEKFDPRKFFDGIKKIVAIAVGCGAIVFVIRIVGQKMSTEQMSGMFNIEYVSGILLEPIAQYFMKIVNNIRALIDGSEEGKMHGK